MLLEIKKALDDIKDLVEWIEEPESRREINNFSALARLDRAEEMIKKFQEIIQAVQDADYDKVFLMAMGNKLEDQEFKKCHLCEKVMKADGDEYVEGEVIECLECDEKTRSKNG